MAQDIDVIDLRRSYLPIPPEAFPNTLHNTAPEDQPEARIPVMPYDGYNFMPTPQGYASFFGINSKLEVKSLYNIAAILDDEITGYTYPEGLTLEEVKTWFAVSWMAVADWDAVLATYAVPDDAGLLTQKPGPGDYFDIFDFVYGESGGDADAALGARVAIQAILVPAVIGTLGGVDDIFMIQTDLFENIIVALCDDGIWTVRPNSGDAWTHIVVLAIPTEHRNWSRCVIDNIVYTYRQAEINVFTASPTNGYTFTGATVTGVNMVGQLGIFKAGGRLGFWDSENSTGWSSLVEPLQFGDSEQLSGFTIFQDIVGRIVVVLQHGDGFIIYCTKSIVWVRRNPGSAMLFVGSSIYNNNGISYRSEAVFADPDTTHFAMTTQGMAEINSGKAEIVMPEIITYFKEKRQPIALRILNGRYLHFMFLDPSYILGRFAVHTEEFQGSTLNFAAANRTIDAWTSGNSTSPCRAVSAINKGLESTYLNDAFGYTANTQAAAASSVPVWEDHFATVILNTVLVAWKGFTPGFFGDPAYFNTEFNAEGGVPKLTGGTEFFIPNGMKLASAFIAADMKIVDHDPLEGFYPRQEMLWLAEERFVKDWKYAIDHKDHPNYENAEVHVNYSHTPTISNITTKQEHTFGPYIDTSFFSEANRYYGLSDNRKNVWLQRSLVRGITVTIREKQIEAHTSQMLPWIPTINFGDFATSLPAYPTAAGVALAAPILKSLVEAWAPVDQNPAVIVGPLFRQDITGIQEIAFTAKDSTSTIIYGNITYQPNGTLIIILPDVGTADVFDNRVQTTQTFDTPEYSYEDFEPCIYTELGFMKIVKHGHYNLLGAFVQDDTTPEANGYEDQCDTPPPKRRRPSFLGLPISVGGDGFPCFHPPAITIDAITYTYPAESVTIPGGEIRLVDGTYEPIHPTYLGAFVFDIQYKKWGKMNQLHKHLLDLFPINNVAGDRTIPYNTFLPRSAALLPDGRIYPFDQYPLDSQIVFGKYGSYRKGFTDLHEVRVQNRTPFSGFVTVEGSLDGREISPAISYSVTYIDSMRIDTTPNLSARWYNVIVEGNYDLTFMEARSSRAGRR